MSMTNIEAVKFVMIPGTLEQIEKAAHQGGNMAVAGEMMGMKHVRNGFYVLTAMTTIAAIATAMADKETTMRYIGTTVATVGVGLTTFVGKKLCNIISNIGR